MEIVDYAVRHLAKRFAAIVTTIKIDLWALGLLFLAINLCSCVEKPSYRWQKKPESFEWLRNKRIFIDPGHGGIGSKDKFRIGPNGITEEEINLSVALKLNDMLEIVGAITKLSRDRDVEVSIGSRIAMAKRFHPDLLVSLHHNGSSRRMDNVNYACVFAWGNKDVKPASFDLAEILQQEFNKIINQTGKVISDFTVFNETGARILRETKYLCPGVIGEAGFFSHPEQADKFRQQEYLQLEAEAYFQAISKFFEWRAPEPQIIFGCRKSKNGCLSKTIRNKDLDIFLKIDSTAEKDLINPDTIQATIDGIKLKIQKTATNQFLLDFSGALYPGEHKIRFQYRNKFNQSSMVYSTSFSIDVRKGDFQSLKTRGIRLINASESRAADGRSKKFTNGKNTKSFRVKKSTSNKSAHPSHTKGKKSKNARSKRTTNAKRTNNKGRSRNKDIIEGIKMLLAALSLGPTDPEADMLIYYIAKGFELLGDKTNSDYYYKRLYYFYPESSLRESIRNQTSLLDGYRHPVEFRGKRIGYTLTNKKL